MAATSITARPTTAPAGMGAALRPLLLDVGLPLGAYYVLHSGAGLSTVAALGASSAVSAVRALTGLLRERQVHRLSLAVLALNLAGIALAFVGGDPRLVLAKDSVGSGVLGLAALVTAFWGGQPLMSSAVRPMMTRGDAAREAVWQRLEATDGTFRRAMRRYSAAWGIGLLAECTLRIVGAYVLPVQTMVWLSTVLMLTAITVLVLLTHVLLAPAVRLVKAEISRA